jgi:hypothetical protein
VALVVVAVVVQALQLEMVRLELARKDLTVRLETPQVILQAAVVVVWVRLVEQMVVLSAVTEPLVFLLMVQRHQQDKMLVGLSFTAAVVVARYI